MYIQLDEAKKHLNIEDDFTEDDEYIMSLISVAESAVRVHINDDFETIAEKNGGSLPAPILQAALLMIGNLYQNREILGTKLQALPYNYQYLIDLYKNYNN
jgi:uncharacterized phage protein (predicted DNA packaging)